MANDQDFIQGIKVFKPSDNAPSFIIANGSIDLDQFTEWAKSQPGNTVKFQIKSAKETGYYYISVDNYQKRS